MEISVKGKGAAGINPAAPDFFALVLEDALGGDELLLLLADGIILRDADAGDDALVREHDERYPPAVMELDEVLGIVARIDETGGLLAADLELLAELRRNADQREHRVVLDADDAVGGRLAERMGGTESVVGLPDSVGLPFDGLRRRLSDDGCLAHVKNSQVGCATENSLHFQN